MIPGVKAVISLVKIPLPVPSEVILFAMVGPVVVLQQTPRPVTSDPPSDVILPPLKAVVEVIEDMGINNMPSVNVLADVCRDELLFELDAAFILEQDSSKSVENS